MTFKYFLRGILAFCLILYVMIPIAQAQTLKPLPNVTKMAVNDFIAQAQHVKKDYEDDSLLSFEIEIPSNFIIKSKNNLKNRIDDEGRLLGEIFYAYGPTVYDLRSYVSVKSIELHRLISAKNWFVSTALKKNYTLRGLENDQYGETFEAFYIRLDNFDRSEVVRARGFLHQDRLVMVEYVVPVELYEAEKDKQIFTVKSFSFLNEYQIDYPERIAEYVYLDSFSINYPQTWILTRQKNDQVNRHDVTFKTSDENGFLVATIDATVISKKSLKDRFDNTIYSINLPLLVTTVKDNLADKGYDIDPMLERISNKSMLDYPTDIAATEVYPLRRKKSDVFIDDRHNNIVQEFWLTVIKTPKEDGKNYILSMIAPSRDIDLYSWSIATQAYNLMIETIR